MAVKAMIALAVTSVCALLITTSCSTSDAYSAPGVYVVVGYPNHYYHEGHFYRQTGTMWEMSLKLDSGWSSVSGKPLPPGLKQKGKSKTYGKANGRARGKHNRP